MSDSDQGVVSEVTEETVGLGGHVGKTVIQEVGKIATGVIGGAVGKEASTNFSNKAKTFSCPTTAKTENHYFSTTTAATTKFT
jgi:hypothetical protein